MPFAAESGSNERASIVALDSASASEVLALTNGIIAGDEAAAQKFFETYCDRLFRYLLVVARGDEETAREILSVTMIKATRQMRSLPSEVDLWRWLTRIAWTSFVDFCRKRKRRIATVNDESVTLNAPALDHDTSMSLALTECLSELPAEERAIVEAYYFEHQSQTELAAQMQSTRKAVESRLARIRQKLRAALLQKIS